MPVLQQVRGAGWTVLLPPAVLAAAVAAWGVDVPYWDHWAMAPLVGRLFDGTLTLGDLWPQQNDHRVFFPRLVMMALALASDWNVRWELAANVACAGLIFLVVRRWLARHAAARDRTFPAFLASLLVFNLNQWENWAWGLQLIVMVNAAALAGGLALLAADARRVHHLCGAAALGIVATFSFANGLLFWPLSTLLVMLPEEGRRQRVTAWIVLAVATLAVFFHGYTFTAAESWRPQSLFDLVRFAAFVAVYLGAPVFAYDGKLAGAGGALAVVVFGTLLVRILRTSPSIRRPALAWTALAGYGVGSGMLAAIGRLQLGLPSALSSRYIVFSNFFWIGLVGLALLRLQDASTRRSPPRLLLRTAAAAVTLSLVAGLVWGGVLLQAQYHERTRAVEALRSGDLDANQPLLYPQNRIPPASVDILRRHRLSLFR